MNPLICDAAARVTAEQGGSEVVRAHYENKMLKSMIDDADSDSGSEYSEDEDFFRAAAESVSCTKERIDDQYDAQVHFVVSAHNGPKSLTQQRYSFKHAGSIIAPLIYIESLSS